jgi:hypothetical protein
MSRKESRRGEKKAGRLDKQGKEGKAKQKQKNTTLWVYRKRRSIEKSAQAKPNTAERSGGGERSNLREKAKEEEKVMQRAGRRERSIKSGIRKRSHVNFDWTRASMCSCRSLWARRT